MADETDPTIERSTQRERVERRTRLVPADVQAIFDLLADPAAHARFDGSGTVQSSSREQPDRLSLGSKFGMKMRLGVPYRMTNEVVEFDEPNLIAWRHLGRHVWRYRLQAVDGGTEVTEEFDWGPSLAPWAIELAGYPARNGRALDATLDRLVELFADGGEGDTAGDDGADDRRAESGD